jgi:hypothetical protein
MSRETIPVAIAIRISNNVGIRIIINLYFQYKKVPILNDYLLYSSGTRFQTRIK